MINGKLKTASNKRPAQRIHLNLLNVLIFIYHNDYYLYLTWVRDYSQHVSILSSITYILYYICSMGHGPSAHFSIQVQMCIYIYIRFTPMSKQAARATSYKARNINYRSAT